MDQNLWFPGGLILTHTHVSFHYESSGRTPACTHWVVVFGQEDALSKNTQHIHTHTHSEIPTALLEAARSDKLVRIPQQTRCLGKGTANLQVFEAKDKGRNRKKMRPVQVRDDPGEGVSVVARFRRALDGVQTIPAKHAPQAPWDVRPWS